MLIGAAWAWTLLGAEGVPTKREITAAAFFAPAPLPPSPVRTDPQALAAAAAEALRYLRAHPEDPGATAGLFAELGVDLARVERTLQLVVDVAAADAATGGPSRLQDPAWLAATFEWLRWSPDPAAPRPPPSGTIRLTRYFIPQVAGSAVPTAACPVALYADPGPTGRARYTRREVLDGAWIRDPEAPSALVWVSRAVAHDAMMQGTVEIQLPTGPLRVNVDQHNGRPYRPGVASEEQERLWYFRVVEGVRGWGTAADKVGLAAGASVAGDVYNLGLGKLFLLEDPQAGMVRLVVLGDTGGAFQPNLHQLDDYVGAFPDRRALAAAVAGQSDHVRAGVLLAR